MLSTDFSEVVIEKMRTRHQVRRPGLRWEKMDMLALDLEDGSVDAVVDKVSDSGRKISLHLLALKEYADMLEQHSLVGEETP